MFVVVVGCVMIFGGWFHGDVVVGCIDGDHGGWLY